MSDDIVERVAVAMRIAYARLNHDEPPVPFDKSRARDEWLCCARAAIEALREPTKAMLDAAYEAHDAYEAAPEPKAWCGLSSAFQAMIDRALQPATDSEAQS
jgi:hypothetical protein